MHSSNCGALLRLSEAICDLCKFSTRANIRLAFAGAIASRYQIVGGGVSARHLKVSRHRDPAPVGVCHTVPVEVIAPSIALERMSCRKKAPSASGRLL